MLSRASVGVLASRAVWAPSDCAIPRPAAGDSRFGDAKRWFSGLPRETITEVPLGDTHNATIPDGNAPAPAAQASLAIDTYVPPIDVVGERAYNPETGRQLSLCIAGEAEHPRRF